VQRVASEDEARELAHRLLLPGRQRPTVVLTIAGGHTEPFGDPEEIQEAYSPQDGRRLTELLINDALEAALAGGVLALRSSPGLRPALLAHPGPVRAVPRRPARRLPPLTHVPQATTHG
jgi:hypothetical protein